MILTLVDPAVSLLSTAVAGFATTFFSVTFFTCAIALIEKMLNKAVLIKILLMFIKYKIVFLNKFLRLKIKQNMVFQKIFLFK